MDLKSLCEAQGLSGREEQVRRLIIAECEKKLGKNAVTVDKMGSVIAVKKGKSAKAPRVMLAAHTDEVGLMIVSATDDGLLHFRNVGGVDPRVLVSKRVKVGYADGDKQPLAGVIGAMAIHQQTAEDRKNVLPIDQLYIDVGAKDKAEAERVAPAGTPVTFDTEYTPFGDNCVLSKALDDRVGVYNMLRLLDVESDSEITFAFTSQEEVGCRGATGAAYRVQPDVAIVLEGTTANDLGDTPDAAKVCQVGKGVTVSFMDNASIGNVELVRTMLKLADENGIAHQVKQSVTGGNDAGSIQRSANGCRTVVLSVPCRNIHSASSVCSLDDVEAQMQLAQAYLTSKIK